jgi:hypothetical protein
MSRTPAIGFSSSGDFPVDTSRPGRCAALRISPRGLSGILLTALILSAACIPAAGQGITRNPPVKPTPDRLFAQGDIETCNDTVNNPHHILPAGNQTTDLQIDGINCVVDGTATINGVPGSYVYRNVNIYNGGTLTFNDALIDFHAHSILVEMNSTLQAGATSPLIGPLTIWLWGTATDTAPSITCLSDSKNQCGVPDAVWTSNPNVPMKEMPTIACNPASKYGYTLPNDDCFYQYEILDPADKAGAYFGRKVLAVSAGGNLMLRGAKGIRTGTIETSPGDSSTSWGHLISTLHGSLNGQTGETSFYIDRAVPTWGAGDHIAVTTTDYLPSHTEEFVIKDVETDANGTRIDIDTSQLAPMNAVQFPHWGQGYDYSEIVANNANVGPAPDPNLTNVTTLPASHIETRAVVALLSRSIRIASEGANPVIPRTSEHFPETPNSFYGGHTIVRDGFSTYQVQGVEFYQLGQGGAIGRYPVHFHMTRSVPQPNPMANFLGTYVADSSIVDSMTRFITVHATDGVTLARNVGYKSIGHGYYLEDATEINNRLYSNVGISVRGALADRFTNPRMIPGILDLPDGSPGAQIPDIPPYYTDVVNPTAFWIMNTWNDFEYNVAVGVGACGACYWMPPAGISGPSQYETWKSYAGMQKSDVQYGEVPMMTFTGNSCSAAMAAIVTVGQTNPCLGVAFGQGTSTQNQLYSVLNPNSTAKSNYPVEGLGQRQKTTICDPAQQNDCSVAPPCTGVSPGLANCVPFAIDHFTTSFNWAPTNFAAIWLRGWWFLVGNSAITDSQNGGITFVSGGGYSRSDASQGFWSVLKNSILVGNTQPIGSNGFPDNPFASNAGPFTPKGIVCPYNPAFCLSLADGIAFVGSNFGVNQRLFNIYDGPSSEYNNIYSDVHVTTLGTVADCKPGGNDQQGNCEGLNYMNGNTIGVLQSPPTGLTTNNCILPNAAIAWKQPNGFYYPPAFNSDNLVFNNVDIRHFVIQPLYLPNSFTDDTATVQKTYCTWQYGMFGASFTDIDRQTELTDNDGTLTGLTANDTQATPPEGPTISVTKDVFYNAPLTTDECASGQPPAQPISNDNGATVDTSPYEYFTAAVVAECALNGGDCSGQWTNNNCSTPTCYGVPLYRQSLTAAEFENYQTNNTRYSIRMMGQASAQRSTLTLNHASYYIDTTVPLSVQNPNNGARQVNVFQGGQSYDVFFLFATNTAKQTYSIYIGTGLTEAQAQAVIIPGRMGIPDNSFPFTTNPGGAWATFGSYNSTTGLLTVNINLSQQSDLDITSREEFCQPTTYCSWNSSANTCGCKFVGSCHNGASCTKGGSCADGSTCTNTTGCTDDQVCSYATKDIDCPVAGCYGFRITLPEGFVAQPQTNLPPAPVLFTSTDPYFEPGTVAFIGASESVAGNCHYSTVPTQPTSPTFARPGGGRLMPQQPMPPTRWPNP